jgi:hypothetical protein
MRWRITAYLIIILLNGVIGFYLVANVYDWKIDFLNINPSEKQNERIQSFDYPSSGPTGPHIIIGENGTTGLPLLSITIGLLYDGTLAERSPAYLTASGSIYPEGVQVIDEVNIGFEGASHYSETGPVLSNTPPVYAPNLEPTDVYTLTTLMDTVPTLPITWDVQGDYCAYIYVSFKNGSAPTTITLQDFTVHVNGLDAVRQEDYRRISFATNVALVLFAFDGSVFVAYLFERRAKKNASRDRRLPRRKRQHKQ